MSVEILDPAFLRRVEALNRVSRKIFSGEVHGEAPTSRQGHGTQFHDFRPYAYGDDLRYVDWNIYARLGTMVVKQFESEENPELLLVVDVSPSMDFGEKNKLSYATVVAASIGYLVLANLGTIRLATAPPQEERTAPTYRGVGSVAPLFERLARMETRPCEDAFAGLIDFLSTARKLTGVVILSDFYDVASFSRLAAYLRHRKTRVFCVHVVSREELDPDEPAEVLVDAETGRRHLVHSGRETLKAYRSAFRRHCLQVEAECKRGEIGYTRVDTTTSFVQTVINLFHARRRMR